MELDINKVLDLYKQRVAELEHELILLTIFFTSSVSIPVYKVKSAIVSTALLVLLFRAIPC